MIKDEKDKYLSSYKFLCGCIYYAGNVEFFFVDTTPFQDKYFTETDHTYDWRGVLPRQQYLTNLLKVTNHET